MNTMSLKDDKYHILLIYLLHEDGYYDGGYDAKLLNLRGADGGESYEEMVDQVYESLKDCIEGESDIPFDIENTKESIVFDTVECSAIDSKRQGTGCKDINKAIYSKIPSFPFSNNQKYIIQQSTFSSIET